MKTKLLTICLLLLNFQLFANYEQGDIEHWPIIGLWKEGYSTPANDGGFVTALIIYQDNNLYKYIYLSNFIRDPQPFYWTDDQTGEEILHNTEAEDTIQFSRPFFSKEGFSTKKELIKKLAPKGRNAHIEEMSWTKGIRIFFWRGETKEDMESWSHDPNFFVKDPTIDKKQLLGIVECIKNSSDEEFGENLVKEYFGKDKKQLPESRQCLGKDMNYFLTLSPYIDG